MRNYASVLPIMSHAYNFQANAYNFTNSSVMANNAASAADPAVDPTLQVALSCGLNTDMDIIAACSSVNLSSIYICLLKAYARESVDVLFDIAIKTHLY